MAWGVSALLILFTACFGLAARLDLLRAGQPQRPAPAGALEVLLGDSRRLFASQFFIEADRYFHNGYYPSIFDQNSPGEKPHIVEATQPGHAESERAANFLGHPRDWIDAFGRHFYPTTHAHADETGDTREILPWLRLSATLDPHRIQTYVVAAFWLRTRMSKVDEAEQFLRDGWRENPDSYAILLELGQLYLENRHDPDRARNLLELALKRWNRQEASKPETDRLAFLEITGLLAKLEEQTGHYQRAIGYLEQLSARSPSRAAIQQQIDGLKRKLARPSSQSQPGQPKP